MLLRSDKHALVIEREYQEAQGKLQLFIAAKNGL